MDEESIGSGFGPRQSKLKFYKTTLRLAYQSFGVVYGDLITSPIYVYKSTLGGSLRLHEEDDEIFGVLSLVFWTLTLIPLCKYIIFVLGADDNGEGGTLALYSLLCRRARLGLLSVSHLPGDDLLADNSVSAHNETRTSALLREFFDKYHSSRVVLLLVVLLGTSMVISDGVLTPAMSVLSAVSGLKIKATSLHDNYTLLIACTILVGLFALQHFGTHRMGFLFAPVLLAWLFSITGIGLYNVIYWNPRVVSALSPYYVYNFFKKTGKDGWSSLGGIVLCITGAEAMFADLGHFSTLSIRIAFTTVVYPCMVVTYLGEAAYLSKNKEDLQKSFYKSIPEVVFWPVFIIATLATIVGSQAIISGTFSIISQCRALKCFPRVKIKHTSKEIHGQIYIPEVNWGLMVTCLAVVVCFGDTNSIGNAYGLAVITVMLVTTCLMFLVIVMVWKQNVFSALLFVTVFGSIELLYFSACLTKFHKGGWFPIVLSLILVSIMCIWHYGTLKKHSYELQNRVGVDTLLSLGLNFGINRVPGICLVYSNTVSDVPPMFSHFVTNFPAFHRILIFVTFQPLTVPRVPSEQQFLVSRIDPSELRLFRCIVRYGYKDARKDTHAFESRVLENLTAFLQNCDDHENARSHGAQEIVAIQHPSSRVADAVAEQPQSRGRRKRVRFRGVGGNKELEEVEEARERAGVAYMMANTYVLANETSSILKKMVINIGYRFLRQNCRRPATSLGVPHRSLIEVGMVYHV